MSFKVRYLVHGLPEGHERTRDLETARTLAEDYAAADPAHSAEVVAVGGSVLFRRPRTVPRA